LRAAAGLRRRCPPGQDRGTRTRRRGRSPRLPHPGKNPVQAIRSGLNRLGRLTQRAAQVVSELTF